MSTKKNKLKSKLKRRIKNKRSSHSINTSIEDKEFKEIMEKRGEDFKDKREKYLYYETLNRWKDSNQKNPFDVAL